MEAGMMNEKVKEKKKLTFKERQALAIQGLVAADQVGKTEGLKIFLKYFDYYKVVASVFMAVLMIYFFISKGWIMGTLVAIALHLHLFLNQIWWKLRTLEAKME
jgi:hypothetical protein